MVETKHARLSDKEAAELLGRLMLAWDGQWFLKVAEECGLEKAVALNARVRASFARIEMREYCNALGISGVASLEEVVALLRGYAEIFLGDRMQGRWAIPNEDSAVVTVCRCGPQEGASKAGLKPDTPCIACGPLWVAWLEAALPGTSWEARIERSMGRGARECEIRINRKEREAGEPPGAG